MAFNSANYKHGSEDFTSSSRSKPTGEPRAKLERIVLDQMGVAYPVKVTSAKAVESSRGDDQLQVSLAVHIDGGDAIGAITEWFTLPFQDSDNNLDAETARKINMRRRDDLVRILSAATPAKFALYKTKQGEGKEAVYFGFDGKTMSKEDLNAREIEINREAMEWAKTAHASIGEYIDELKDATLYLVKVENPKNPKYPYTNVYSVRPSKLPVFEG